MRDITDAHIHLVPGVDDGARDIEEAIEEIKVEVACGVNRIIVTPHSSAFDYKDNDTRGRFDVLKREVTLRNVPVVLYLGCEILCLREDIDECIRNVVEVKYPTMAGSKYILIEFDPYECIDEDAVFCVTRIIKAGYVPIVAHVERDDFTTMEAVMQMREAGALIQINLYSIQNNSSEDRRVLTRKLLMAELVDFVGTDAHRLSHRPPVLEDGIRWIEENCSEEYRRKIFQGNVDEIINGVQ